MSDQEEGRWSSRWDEGTVVLEEAALWSSSLPSSDLQQLEADGCYQVKSLMKLGQTEELTASSTRLFLLHV